MITWDSSSDITQLLYCQSRVCVTVYKYLNTLLRWLSCYSVLVARSPPPPAWCCLVQERLYTGGCLFSEVTQLLHRALVEPLNNFCRGGGQLWQGCPKLTCWHCALTAPASFSWNHNPVRKVLPRTSPAQVTEFTVQVWHPRIYCQYLSLSCTNTFCEGSICYTQHFILWQLQHKQMRANDVTPPWHSKLSWYDLCFL